MLRKRASKSNYEVRSSECTGAGKETSEGGDYIPARMRKRERGEGKRKGTLTLASRIIEEAKSKVSEADGGRRKTGPVKGVDERQKRSDAVDRRGRRTRGTGNSRETQADEPKGGNTAREEISGAENNGQDKAERVEGTNGAAEDGVQGMSGSGMGTRRGGKGGGDKVGEGRTEDRDKRSRRRRRNMRGKREGAHGSGR